MPAPNPNSRPRRRQTPVNAPAASRIAIAIAIPIEQKQGAAGGVAQPMRLFQNRIEYGRRITRRRVDGLEHFGGRGLLGERFGELAAQLGVLPFESGLSIVALALHGQDSTTARAAAR